MLRRISLTTYRKCGGGFAKTGWAKPSPVPAHCAGTVDGVTSAHGAGKPPRRFAAPLPRGEFTGETSASSQPRNPASPQPTCAPPFPSVEGCRPQAAGWFPRRTQPPSNPRL
ncbi:MAG: hypothetical protein LBM98_00405 [Oscillospiraceae bacterium]|nr:hypothetical protein [Oscillospiraceae bacterium]